jgi:predicted dehydrogenase
MTNAVVNLGLAGTGAWGMNYLAAADEAEGVTLAHVASPHVADKSLPENITGHANWRDLLSLGLDGLIIATPPETHFGIAEAALNAGLAVLVEKPVTLNSRNAEVLYELAKRKSGILHVGHIDLQNPAFVAIRNLLPAKPDIRKITGHWSNAGPWRDDATPLWDWGPHPLACGVSLAGTPTGPWHARYEIVGDGRLYQVYGDFNGIEFELNFGNGDTRRQRSLEIISDDHVYRYDDDFAHKALIDGKPVDYAATSQMTAEVERLAGAIRLGQEDFSDGALALEVIRLLEDIEEKTA